MRIDAMEVANDAGTTRATVRRSGKTFSIGVEYAGGRKMATSRSTVYETAELLLAEVDGHRRAAPASEFYRLCNVLAKFGGVAASSELFGR